MTQNNPLQDLCIMETPIAAAAGKTSEAVSLVKFSPCRVPSMVFFAP